MIEIDRDRGYQAVLTRDPRFDGVFFVGVSTTRIYCRTICRAKTPQQKNCTFYPSAAAAERAGFRPCLLCRPELAPGNSRMDSSGRLANAIARRIEDGTFIEQRFAEFAKEFGVSDRHLRRIVQQEFGVSPIELAQTQRLLFAKQLLTDSALSITDIAFASGFGSVRRFNALFKDRYRLNPTQIRKSKTTAIATEDIICEVAYRPPLDWEALLSYLGGRAIAGVECVEGDRYCRTVQLGEMQLGKVGQHRGWLSVEPIRGKNALRVRLSHSLIPVLLPVMTKIKALFDLAAEPQQIATHLGSLALHHPGLRVPGAFDGFEIAVRVILGQQVSVKAASTLMSRFVQRFGEAIATPLPQLTHLTPTVERILQAEIQEIVSLGILESRAKSILALARAIADRTISLTYGCAIAETISQLMELSGIGEWTANYIAMRVLGDPDIFLNTDLVIKRILQENSAKKILAIAAKWQPWRSYATLHLWKSLEREEGFIAESIPSNSSQIAPPISIVLTKMPKIYFTTYDSPIQSLRLTSDGRSLTGIYMMSEKHASIAQSEWIEADAIAPFAETKAQLTAYFAGNLTEFDLPLQMHGTDFQVKVWSALKTIPFGKTISYGELAQQIGQPKASRAVGLANGRNPISIVVPCHRVIGANGKLTGYGGGIDRKQWLLSHENAIGIELFKLE